MKMVKTVWSAISTVLVVAVVLLAGALIGARVFGIQVYAVLSGSMEPTIQTGALVYVKPAQAEEIQTGDVITFSVGDGVIATHRVVDVTQSGGRPAFRTKGDANRVEDSRTITADELVGKVILSIPRMGTFMEYIQSKQGRMVAIAAGVLLVVFVALPDLLFPAEKKPKEKEAAANGDAPEAAATENCVSEAEGRSDA